MTGLAAVAVMLVSCSAAASLILVLPVVVAAESLSHCSPTTIRRFWIITNILPLAAGCLLTAAAFLFQFGDLTATPHQDPVRLHFCLLRLAQMPDAPFRFRLCALFALGLLVYALARFILSLGATWRAEKLAAKLVTANSPSPSVVVLDSDDPDCFSLGLTRPVVVVTRGLQRLLSGPEGDAVQAHERCHLRHSDNLLELLMRLVSDPLIWLPTTHFYLRSVRAAVEQTCDAAAAAATSPEVVVSALQKMEGAKKARQLKLQGDLASLRPTFASYASPGARIAALLGERYSSVALPLTVVVAIEATVLLVALLSLARPLHDTLHCAAQSLLLVFRG